MGRSNGNRPRGYLPDKDDPVPDRDAVGENNQDPGKGNLSDNPGISPVVKYCLTMRRNVRSDDMNGQGVRPG